MDTYFGKNLHILLFGVLTQTVVEGRGRHAEILAHISAEIRLGGEAKHIGDLGEGEAARAQEAGDVERGETAYPVGGGKSAHGLGHLGEVFGSHAENVGIT